MKLRTLCRRASMSRLDQLEERLSTCASAPCPTSRSRASQVPGAGCPAPFGAHLLQDAAGEEPHLEHVLDAAGAGLLGGLADHLLELVREILGQERAGPAPRGPCLALHAHLLDELLELLHQLVHVDALGRPMPAASSNDWRRLVVEGRTSRGRTAGRRWGCRRCASPWWCAGRRLKISRSSTAGSSSRAMKASMDSATETRTPALAEQVRELDDLLLHGGPASGGEFDPLVEGALLGRLGRLVGRLRLGRLSASAASGLLLGLAARSGGRARSGPSGCRPRT